MVTHVNDGHNFVSHSGKHISVKSMNKDLMSRATREPIWLFTLMRLTIVFDFGVHLIACVVEVY